MGVHAVRRTSARAAEPLADVLVCGGEDEPATGPRRAQVAAATALVLTGVAAAAALPVPGVPDGDGRRTPGSVELSLVDGAVALPRRDAPPVRGRVEGGVHVEVVNEGREPVGLLSAVLTPGRWQVAVVDDVDGSAAPDAAARLLRPGRSAVLVLHRSFACTPGADHGPPPTSMSLEVEVDGRARTHALDVPTAYGGGLWALLGSAETFCAARGGTAAVGTVGDPGLPFLPLWPAGPGVLPSP